MFQSLIIILISKNKTTILKLKNITIPIYICNSKTEWREKRCVQFTKGYNLTMFAGHKHNLIWESESKSSMYAGKCGHLGVLYVPSHRNSCNVWTLVCRWNLGMSIYILKQLWSAQATGQTLWQADMDKE